MTDLAIQSLTLAARVGPSLTAGALSAVPADGAGRGWAFVGVWVLIAAVILAFVFGRSRRSSRRR